MTGYGKSYIDVIYRGLEELAVTDGNGQRIHIEDGMRIWTDRVQQMRQDTGGLIFFCGNGASASMAEHMSHDWFQNAMINTTTCGEVTHITAISNDINYEEVFSYRIKRILSERDMLVGISSSGNSSNIVNAVSAAVENGAFTITISGMEEDNRIRSMGDLNFYVPLKHYGEVESAHAVLLHSVLDYFLDQYMGGRH